MYKLEYLPVARQDLIDIVRYISQELKNPEAADRLAMEMIAASEALLDFPYSCPAYLPIRPLKHEYRKLIVQNYLYKTPSSKSLMLEFSTKQLYWYNLYIEQLELIWSKGH